MAKKTTEDSRYLTGPIPITDLVRRAPGVFCYYETRNPARAQVYAASIASRIGGSLAQGQMIAISRGLGTVHLLRVEVVRSGRARKTPGRPRKQKEGEQA